MKKSLVSTILLYCVFCIGLNAYAMLPSFFEYELVVPHFSNAYLPESLPVQGNNSEAYIEHLKSPVISNQGDLAFSAFVSTNTIPPTLISALYSKPKDDTPKTVAIDGQPAHGPLYPNGGVYGFDYFKMVPSIADNRQIAYEATISDSIDALWVANSPDDINLLVQQYQSLPGIQGSITSFMHKQYDNGNLMVGATYEYVDGGIKTSSAIWKIDPAGQAQLILKNPEEQHLYFINGVMDPVGNFYFTAKYDALGNGVRSDRLYFWDADTGVITQLLRANNDGPDVDHIFISIFALEVYGEGKFSFIGYISNKATNEISSAIWRSDGEGGYEAVAFLGDIVTSTSGDLIIEGFYDILHSIDGDAYFTANCNGKRTLVGSDSDGNLHSIIRVGDPAPGLDNGTQVKQIDNFKLTSNGDLLIEVGTVDNNGTITKVIYFSDGYNLMPVLYRGIIFERKNGEMFAADIVDYKPRLEGTNDLGQMAFVASTLYYANGGLFVVTPVYLDIDNDGILDDIDNCINTPNPNQLDFDGDGIGDVCDTDDDNDGVLDTGDNCQFMVNPDQTDNEMDGIGDVCDPDDDNDGIDDVDDNCPNISNPDQADLDGDYVGDACDAVLNVDGSIESVLLMVDDVDLNVGIAQAFQKKLINAMDSFYSGDSDIAVGLLNAYAKQVEAKRGKDIDDATADALIEAAQAIIDAITDEYAE